MRSNPSLKGFYSVAFETVPMLVSLTVNLHSERRFPAPSSTPSIAFRHLPPNSARFSYATEGALFISAQLSTDAVSALRKVRVLIRQETT